DSGTGNPAGVHWPHARRLRPRCIFPAHRLRRTEDGAAGNAVRDPSPAPAGDSVRESEPTAGLAGAARRAIVTTKARNATARRLLLRAQPAAEACARVHWLQG